MSMFYLSVWKSSCSIRTGGRTGRHADRQNEGTRALRTTAVQTRVKINTWKAIQITQHKCFLIQVADFFLRLQQIQCNSGITPRSAITETGQAMSNNVTLRRVRATIVTVDKQQVLHILRVCL
jgi:hypothetical protein